MRVERDDHHLCHAQQEWLLRPEAAAIRRNSSMIFRGMGRCAHEQLHAETAPVPVPSYYVLRHVANQLPKGLHIVRGIDTYSSLVEEAVKHRRCKPVERQLGLLSVEAVRAQMPYIYDELSYAERMHFV